MRRLRRLGGAVAGVVLGILVAVAAFGTLYWLRGPTASWPGPRIRDALPLDELPHHDAVNLFVYLLVWGLAAMLLGALARRGKMGRLPAAILLAAGLAVFVYVLTGFSIYIVRGVSRAVVLRAPSHVRAVFVPPALAGAAGALMGRQKRSRTRGPLVLAVLVAAAGLLDIVSAITPEIARRLRTLEHFAPRPIPPLASAAVVPIGLVLLLLARGLARRKRAAWLLAIWLLAGSSALHLLKGLDYEEASITGLLTLGLFARRSEFTVEGDPESGPRLLVWAALLAAAVYGYGLSALWINQEVADRPYSVGFAAAETTRALFGLTIGGSNHVGQSFGRWFPLSVLLLGVASIGYVLIGWLAPWRYRLRQDRESWDLVRSLVARWGADTMSPFLLRADKSFFFDSDGRAALGYTVVAGVAVLSGDPIGPPDAVHRVVREFLEFAKQRDWRVTILGASDRWLDVYGAHGLRWLHHGDEALIETNAFSLEGRPVRKVRQAVGRVERAGFEWEPVWAADLDPALRHELEIITDEWRGNQPQRGFAMALDSPFRLEGQEAVFAIGRDATRNPAGFLHLAVCRAGKALSLSAMPRRRDTPNGFNEWLITHTVAWAKANGFDRLSLNFAPFAALLGREARLSPLQRVERDALLAMKSRFHFQLDNLLMFSGQFHPTWLPRFVVFERWSDLPRVSMAALAAEGYLPFASRFLTVKA